MTYKFMLKRRGFTLIELMVVITIIGLLASVVLASLTNTRKAARDATRVQAVKEFQKALELYRNANGGNYPCATVGCADTGGSAMVQINDGVPDTVTTAINQFYQPPSETMFTPLEVKGTIINTSASIVYRVGSQYENDNNPYRNTYTILLRREQAVGSVPANTWCSISSGKGHGEWNQSQFVEYYPPCY